MKSLVCGIMEAESVRSRAESTGECVKLKTVTEIRRSSACDTFMAASVRLVLHSLWDLEPVLRLKRRSDLYLVFTRMPGESYRRRPRSLLLCSCDVFPALITSLVDGFLKEDL